MSHMRSLTVQPYGPRERGNWQVLVNDSQAPPCPVYTGPNACDNAISYALWKASFAPGTVVHILDEAGELAELRVPVENLAASMGNVGCR